MIYAPRIITCLCIGLALFYTYAHKELHNERNKKMINQTPSSNWITSLQEKASEQSSGSFNAKDKHNNALVARWHILTTQSAHFVPAMNQIADLASQAFTSVEFDFLQAHPEAAGSERLYQSIAPLFQDTVSIDWQAVKNSIYSLINQLYTKTDWAKFGGEDIYIFVTVHDQESDTLLGFITFFVRPTYPHGVCKVTAMGVIPPAQNRGLGKVLMGSIFKIIPEVERIFLCTRVTNSKALAAYRSWGFQIDANPIKEPGHDFNPAYWIFMAYDVKAQKGLQS